METAMEANGKGVRPSGRDVRGLNARQEAYLRARVALTNRDTTSAQADVEALRRSLEAHFALEDEVYFPAVSALRPDLAPLLRRFRFEHESMLACVSDVLARVHAAEVEVLVGELDELIAIAERHEGDEEAIFSSLETAAETP
jgi:hypothetical protein